LVHLKRRDVAAGHLNVVKDMTTMARYEKLPACRIVIAWIVTTTMTNTHGHETILLTDGIP
jgi:hypothetical protein